MSKEGGNSDQKASNNKADKEDNLFMPTKFKRTENSNYASNKDTWQKVDLNFRNKNTSQVL